MKTANTVILLAVLFCLAGLVIFYFIPATQRQISRMKTGDTLGQIIDAIGNTFKTNSTYNPVEETKKMFPKTFVTNGQIPDAWGRPIKISIQRAERGFQVNVTSAGSDGVIGTKDDLNYDGFIPNDTNSLPGYLK